MKCDDCGFLRTEGYEYPESYCGAGVSEDDERFTGDGCTYHYKNLEKGMREIVEAWDRAHEITDEDLKIIFERKNNNE